MVNKYEIDGARGQWKPGSAAELESSFLGEEVLDHIFSIHKTQAEN